MSPGSWVWTRAVQELKQDGGAEGWPGARGAVGTPKAGAGGAPYALTSDEDLEQLGHQQLRVGVNCNDKAVRGGGARPEPPDPPAAASVPRVFPSRKWRRRSRSTVSCAERGTGERGRGSARRSGQRPPGEAAPF